jgi:protein TonB
MKAEMRAGMSHSGTPALFQEDVQHRVLSACVGVSIALHVAVLFAFPGLRPSVSAGSSKPLTATFASTLVQPEAQVAVPELLSRSRREANLDTPQPILAASEPGADAAQPAELTTLPAPGPHTAGAAPTVADTSGASDAPATLGQSTEKYLAESADAGLLEKYRLALIDAAKRYKRYPIRAVEKGWKGRVEIRLVVGPNATIKSTLIKRSSTYQILDDQALDMVKKSTRAEPIPSALRGREFTLDIPVIFELQAG